MERWHVIHTNKYNINARQVDALAYAYLQDSIRPRDYMQHLDTSHETARRELRQLENIGLLISEGYGRARKYKYNEQMSEEE